MRKVIIVAIFVFLLLASFSSAEEYERVCEDVTTEYDHYSCSWGNNTLDGTVTIDIDKSAFPALVFSIKNSLPQDIQLSGKYSIKTNNCSKNIGGIFMTSGLAKTGYTYQHKVNNLYCDNEKIDCIDCEFASIDFELIRPDYYSCSIIKKSETENKCTMVKVPPPPAPKEPSKEQQLIDSKLGDPVAIIVGSAIFSILMIIIGFFSKEIASLCITVSAIGALLPLLAIFRLFVLGYSVEGISYIITYVVVLAVVARLGEVGGEIGESFGGFIEGVLSIFFKNK